MTTLDEIRTALLAQHADLRVHIEATRTATAKWQQDGADHAHPKSCLDRLADAFREHNAAEEAALHAVLPTIDAWGPVRKETMIETHTAEHSELFAMLLESSRTADPAATAASIVTLLDKMLTHMATEEKAFLCADVLNDELKVDSFGG